MARSNIIEQSKKISKERVQYTKADDTKLVELIKELLHERPTYGYKRITALLRGKLKSLGYNAVNHKRVYRVMRQQQLLLQKPNHKPPRAHTGKVQTLHRNTRWCSDSFSIQCMNGELVHVAFSLDTCDREIMKYKACTVGMDGETIRDLMIETVEYRFGDTKVPYAIQWLTDNGSCYVAKETVSFGKSLGLDIRTTPVRSPESNGMAEALVKTLKRDYVWHGDLSSSERVMAQLPRWIEDYNEKAPHKALNMLSPREYIKLNRAG